jgi:sugar/nucleoside kinase (ribokinase family)
MRSHDTQNSLLFRPKCKVRASGLNNKTVYAKAAHSVKLLDAHGAGDPGDLFVGALAASWASGVPVAGAATSQTPQPDFLLAPGRKKKP